MIEGTYSFKLAGIYVRRLYMDLSGVHGIEGDSSVLSCWLQDDLGDFDLYLEMINDAIEGKEIQEFLGGNIFCAYVGKDKTEIRDVSGRPDVLCSLPTKLLREIVVIWLEEYKKFREKQTK